LLILSFPNFNLWWLAWVALVPWLLALRGLGGARAFRWSWLIGFLFFLGSIWWLVRLSAVAGPMAVIGWLALCAYLALFFGLFGWARHRWPGGLLFAPALWVVLEYARSHLLSGFGWNLLAYSQAPWLPVIQIADVTGAWGVSFLIVFVNVAINEAVRDISIFRRHVEEAKNRSVPAFGVALAAAVVLATLAYGAWRIPQVTGAQMTRVAVVQGNIPQEEKWDEAYQGAILDTYEGLTREAARDQPALIVWPETSVPGFLGLDEPLTQRISRLAASVGIPLLVGAPMSRLDRGVDGPVGKMTNSAVLVGADGILGPQYDKLHLVPFGEFVPGEQWLPWLRNALPPIGEFVPGRDDTVFHLGAGLRAQGSGHELGPQPPAQSPELKFSVLVCFEDIFPELARRFVREGARLLLVITNDAWFGPTAAAYQHAQASTLRAVELRVPVARAANTGWSGCIDASGRWGGAVRDAQGRELFTAGTHPCAPSPGTADSLYLRWGDWFVLLCLGVVICRLLVKRV